MAHIYLTFNIIILVNIYVVHFPIYKFEFFGDHRSRDGYEFRIWLHQTDSLQYSYNDTTLLHRNAFILYLFLVSTSVCVSMKSAFRTEIKRALKSLSAESVDAQSAAVHLRLLDLPHYQSCKAVSIYLSMNGEVATTTTVEQCFRDSKKVFIPKILGKRSEDMFMLEVSGVNEISKFPKNSWGIPEPTLDDIASSPEDGTPAGIIDLVLVPGVVFDKHCGRIGHGKGYYGELQPNSYCSMISL